MQNQKRPTRSALQPYRSDSSVWFPYPLKALEQHDKSHTGMDSTNSVTIQSDIFAGFLGPAGAVLGVPDKELTG